MKTVHWFGVLTLAFALGILGCSGDLERHHVRSCIRVVGTLHVDSTRRVEAQDSTQQTCVTLDEKDLLQAGLRQGCVVFIHLVDPVGCVLRPQT